MKPISPGTKATAPKVPFDWAKAKILEDDSVAKKVSSDSWVRSFVKEIMDYQKLDQIGEGETEILGLKIDMVKGILKDGYPDSIGKSYFDLKLVDTGTRIRVYDDNVISVWYKGAFNRLKIGQLTEEGVNIEPLEVARGPKSGIYLKSILIRDYLEKSGFFDKFAIGQETDKVFRIKGIVKDKGVSNDGSYVTIEYKADTGSGSGVKEVRITADGATVNGRSIVDVETGEDGAVYLHYKSGGVRMTPIKLPVTTVNTVKLVEANDLTTEFDYNDIVGKTGAANLLGELDIKSSPDFTERVAYAAFGRNKKAFDAQYGEGKCKALWDVADDFSKSAAEEAVENMGLDIEKVDVKRGVRPEGGVDILTTTKDGKTLILDVEYTKDDFPSAKSHMTKKFAENKADLGMIFYKGKYYVVINSATDYEPLANIAKDIERAAGSRNIRDFGRRADSYEG